MSSKEKEKLGIVVTLTDLTLPTTQLDPLKERIIALLDGASVVIGRESKNQGAKPGKVNAFFTNQIISREHAIILNRNGEVFIIDKSSTHGTFVNGNKCKPHEEVRIHNEDVIQLGGRLGYTISQPTTLAVDLQLHDNLAFPDYSREVGFRPASTLGQESSGSPLNPFQLESRLLVQNPSSNTFHAPDTDSEDEIDEEKGSVMTWKPFVPDNPANKGPATVDDDPLQNVWDSTYRGNNDPLKELYGHVFIGEEQHDSVDDEEEYSDEEESDDDKKDNQSEDAKEVEPTDVAEKGQKDHEQVPPRSLPRYDPELQLESAVDAESFAEQIRRGLGDRDSTRTTTGQLTNLPTRDTFNSIQSLLNPEDYPPAPVAIEFEDHYTYEEEEEDDDDDDDDEDENDYNSEDDSSFLEDSSDEESDDEMTSEDESDLEEPGSVTEVSLRPVEPVEQIHTPPETPENVTRKRPREEDKDEEERELEFHFCPQTLRCNGGNLCCSDECGCKCHIEERAERERAAKRRRVDVGGGWTGAVKSVGKYTVAGLLGGIATFVGLAVTAQKH